MLFFDASCFLGRPMNGSAVAVATGDELLSAMDRAGIEKALVWHVAQREQSVPTGNRLLAEQIAGRTDRLTGCWAFMPNQAHELPPMREFVEQMAESGVRALSSFPDDQHFLLRGESCGEILHVMEQLCIPLVLHVTKGVGWQTAYDLLREFPDLVCILADMGVWGADRWFRPLVERYEGVHIEISEYIQDAGIETFVADYGPDRMLFGTGFPVRDCSQMLTLRHAGIDDEAKKAIAGGNLERLLAAAQL
jgi:predicted TIM-barrel fold metal-dependent hydrolase